MLKISLKMRTITEFSGIALKEAQKLKKALIEGGQAPEQWQASLRETLQLDENRIQFLLSLLELIEARPQNRVEDLKRGIVAQLQEGEKTPTSGWDQKETYFFKVEYFPPLIPASPPKGRMDSSKKGRGSKKRKGRKPRRAEGGPLATPHSKDTASGSDSAQERPARRRPRFSRGPKPSAPSQTNRVVIQPKTAVSPPSGPVIRPKNMGTPLTTESSPPQKTEEPRH
ncbi:MAG: hypothetical protein ACO3A2_11895 [Bdellovibrionia bacterium]